MARHRWATGEYTSGLDRLERVLDRNPDAPRNAEPQAEPAAVLAAEDPGYLAADRETPGSGRSGRRWVATRRAALMAAGCAVVVGCWQVVGIDRGGSDVIPLGPTASSGDRQAAGDEPAAADPQEEETASAMVAQDAADTHAGTVVVHVAGAVRAPGVVEVPAGSRVFEVLKKAGGPLADAELAAVNLASVVQDGQQILIPLRGESFSEAAVPPAPASGTAPINLNTAGAPDLEELPRVGPVLAARIVEWRTQHGPFTRPEDLDAVPGIGPAMLDALLPLVTV